MNVRKFISTLAKFTSTLAFKSIQMTYSLKPLHPSILNFLRSMISLQGFRIVKFSLVENSQWPPLLKIAKLIKWHSPEWLGIFGWNFVWSISRTLMLIDIKMKKFCSRIRSLWSFENTSILKNFTSTHAFKSISPKCLGILGWNFVWSISRTLMLIGIKIKKKC